MPHVETRTEFVVTAGESPKRLDHFLAHREPYYSRTALQRLIEDGHITVDEQVVKPSHKVKPGDRILLVVPRPEPLDIKPEPISLHILHEDEALLVLNKPAGLVVHPAPGHWTGTMVNALLYHMQSGEGHLSSIGGKERPGLVHRLDKETTGILVVAKTDQAHRHLAAQFKAHTISRLYEALVWGSPKTREGRIEFAIGRDTKDRKTFSARTTRPKASLTTYKIIDRMGKLATHVALTPGTGRTHQLRVHLKAIGCPILGDQTYGGKKVMEMEGIDIPRVMLHAKVLGFVHPLTKQSVAFSAPLPEDMETVRRKLTTQGATPS
ncbi:MAG: RluA family pseudouridine synthase [Nitrospirota bacterium]|nr:RluA family pseudouridine synthase [Nitrospirota bacterium]